jgi:hypothetical protein
MVEDFEDVSVRATQTFTIETYVTDFNGHDVVDADYDATSGRRELIHSWERGDIKEQFLEQHLSLDKCIEDCIDVFSKLLSAGIDRVGNHYLAHLKDALLEWCPSDLDVEEL